MLLRARILRRYERYLCDVELDDGRERCSAEPRPPVGNRSAVSDLGARGVGGF